MESRKNIMLFVIAVLCITSCSDNQIYFDIDAQSIKTCNGTAIRNLSIDNLKGQYLFRFVKLKGKEGTNAFSLLSINSNYKLEVMGEEVSLQRFNLEPNTGYVIRNSTYGDASYGELNVKTNDKGKVVVADITSCR